MQDLKVLPHDLDAEKTVLASCLIQPTIIPQVQRALVPTDFYRTVHAQACDVAFYLRDNLTAVSLADGLRRAGVSEADAKALVFELAGWVSTSAGWRYHAEIIREQSQRRQVITACREAESKAHEPTEELHEILSNLKGSVAAVDREHSPEIESALSIVNQVYKETEERWKTGNAFVGTRTGLQNIDNNLSGLEPGTTTYLIARPSIGKSALALTIGDWVAANEGPVLFFSLESNRHALTRRRLAARSGLHLTWIRTGGLRKDQWGAFHDACGYLSDKPLMIVDHARYKDTQALCALAETVSLTKPLKLIVVDHIQLTRPRRPMASRHQEISLASSDLQGLAKTCKCPVLVLCQLSRPDKASKQKYPALEMMKESGDLEQNADNVWGLHRENKESDLARLEQLKGRDSGTWTTWLRFDRFCQRFHDGDEPKPLRPEKEEEF